MPLVGPGFGQATYNLTHEATSRPMAVTMGFDLQAWTGTDVQAADRAFIDFRDNVLPAIDSQITLQSVDLYIGDGTNPSGSVQSVSTPASGTAEWASPVLNTAVLVQKQTGSLGRRGKGRFYLPGAVPENQVSEAGIIDANVLADLNTYLDTWYTAMVTPGSAGFGPLPPVVNGTGPATGFPILAYDITGFNATNLVATQRRRLRK